MAGNFFGKNVVLCSWGESHGPAIGGVLDGLPPNIPLDLDLIRQDVQRRQPGQYLTTDRSEKDAFEILSGVYEGKTLGTPLSFIIYNKDTRSKDYDAYKNVYRPGHGDYVYDKKYGHRDHRGGGRASARETAVRVVAGSIAKQILKKFYPDFKVTGYINQLGPHKVDDSDISKVGETVFHCPDTEQIPVWERYLTELKVRGESCGASIRVLIQGCPVGLGAPVYDKLDADLAKAFMSINAVKAVEIGDGKECINQQSYDEMDAGNTFLSNHAGGILAGISTGQDISATVSFKATSSTQKNRQTIDKSGNIKNISIQGRHDPCVALRAVSIIEAMACLTLLDHHVRHHGQCTF